MPATLLSAQTPPLLASAQLPLSLIPLADWATIVTVTGPDSLKYLQGQVTADLAALPPDQHCLAAHCDAKGKMWSTLRLFHHGTGLAFIEHISLAEKQLLALKKYAVFSQVKITQKPAMQLLGVAGVGARDALNKLFSKLPTQEHNVLRSGAVTLLHFSLPTERFLLIIDEDHAMPGLEKLAALAQWRSSDQWLALEIEAGFPVITLENSGQFIPQATNLHALAGISFTKGCYTGQEIVARAKYRGANKRALYWLVGSAKRVPCIGENLEWQLGAHWRKTGVVLAAIALQDGSLWVQAVLNNDLHADSRLRLADTPDSELHIQPLHYSLVDV